MLKILVFLENLNCGCYYFIKYVVIYVKLYVLRNWVFFWVVKSFYFNDVDR